MYIVNNLLQSGLHTSQPVLISNTISTVGRILCLDFFSMIQPKMQAESYPKSSGIPGALVADDKTLNFLVLLNNLNVASDYTHHLISTFVNASSDILQADRNAGMDINSDSAVPLDELFLFQTEPAIVRDTLKGIEAAPEGKARELTKDGIIVFLSKVFKPKLRPLRAGHSETWSTSSH